MTIETGVSFCSDNCRHTHISPVFTGQRTGHEDYYHLVPGRPDHCPKCKTKISIMPDGTTYRIRKDEDAAQ